MIKQIPRLALTILHFSLVTLSASGIIINVSYYSIYVGDVDHLSFVYFAFVVLTFSHM